MISPRQQEKLVSTSVMMLVVPRPVVFWLFVKVGGIGCTHAIVCDIVSILPILLKYVVYRQNGVFE